MLVDGFQERNFLRFFIYISLTGFFSIENESERIYKMIVFKMKRTCGMSKEILDTDLIRIEDFFCPCAKQTNEKTVRDFENPADLEK